MNEITGKVKNILITSRQQHPGTCSCVYWVVDSELKHEPREAHVGDAAHDARNEAQVGPNLVATSADRHLKWKQVSLSTKALNSRRNQITRSFLDSNVERK